MKLDKLVVFLWQETTHKFCAFTRYLGLRPSIMIDNLDVDPADRILDVRRVIPKMILRPRTGCAVVFAAGFDGGLVEGVYQVVGYVQVRQSDNSLATRRQRTGQTPRRKRKMLIPHHDPQGLLVPFDARDPEERRLVSEAYGGGDRAHPFAETEGFESGEEEFDYLVEFGDWDDEGGVVDLERHG